MRHFFPLAALSRVILIAIAVLSINGLMTPSVAALAAREPKLTLQVDGLTGFFVTPNQPAVLTWKAGGAGSPHTLRWKITDYWGHLVTTGTATITGRDHAIKVPVRLPRGFYEVDFQACGQKFGVVSIAAHHGRAGKYFSIDSAMAWLVNHPATRQSVRQGMIRILRRSGIGLSRERLRWGQINPAPGRFAWNNQCQYDRLAQDYFHNGVRMLQMLAVAPGWIRQRNSGPYPVNLVQTARSWKVIGSYFHTDWGALEMWNEPDMKSRPADQLLPTVKAIAYCFQRADIHVPLIGGVFAQYLSGGFQRSCAMNGLLDQVHAISFHNYASPVALPRTVENYRRWLKAFGKESMPLWITESGKPWPAGTARPRREPDMVSALWITMKAVEARACGIARYFAFVYPFYTEHDAKFNNFGMMGKQYTPLRSMAAYVNGVAELSGWSYVGNLKISDRAVRLAPVFARGNERTAVIYTGKANRNAAFSFSQSDISIRGIDGRILHRHANGSIPIPDGLVYLRGPVNAFTGKIQTTTEAARLYAISRRPPPRPQPHSPIILQFDDRDCSWNKHGYILPDAPASTIAVRVWNLANRNMMVKLALRSHQANGRDRFAPDIQRQIPADGHALVQWAVRNLPRKAHLSIMQYHYLVISGQELSATGKAPAISPLAIAIRLKGTIAQFLDRYPQHVRLKIGQLALWRKNANGTSSFFVPETGGWGLKFAADGGWAYPQFPLPSDMQAKRVAAVLLRARVAKPAKVRLMLFRKTGSPAYCTLSSPIITANGKWQTVLIPLAHLNPMGHNPAQLHNLTGMTFISVGMNNGRTRGGNTLEISKLYLLYRRTAK